MGAIRVTEFVIFLLLGGFVLVGCAGPTKSNTANDEIVEHGESASGREAPAEYKMPESPKTKADDMER